MTSSVAESAPWSPARLRDQWRARPPYHSRPVWALLIVLNVLPWPWGEDVLAGLFTIVGLARPSRRRAALDWAKALDAPRPWHLAAQLCGFRGRWAARTRLLGFRGPGDLRENLVVQGAEHLTATSGAAIILGFHLGPPGGDLPFRILGYPVTFLGWSDRNAAIGWWSRAWRPFLGASPLAFAGGDRNRWPAVLYAARQTLLDGGKISILADGDGAEAFRLPLSVGDWTIRAGWLTLHRLTGAPVLPLLHHLAGRRHVMTFYPPLPSLPSDRPMDLAVWRDSLTRLLEDYVRRFPEQCPHLALAQPWTRGQTVGAGAIAGRSAVR